MQFAAQLYHGQTVGTSTCRLATPVRGRSHKTKCAGGEGAGRGEWGSAFVIEPIFDLFCSVLEPIVLGVRSFLFCFVVLLFFCGGLIPPHFGGITSPQFWGDNPPAFWGIIPHNPPLTPTNPHSLGTLGLSDSFLFDCFRSDSGTRLHPGPRCSRALAIPGIRLQAGCEGADCASCKLQRAKGGQPHCSTMLCYRTLENYHDTATAAITAGCGLRAPPPNIDPRSWQSRFAGGR